MAEGSADCLKGDSLSAESNCLSLADLNKLAKQSPSEVLHFIRNRRSDFIYLLKKDDTEEDLMCFAIIALGLTCSSDRNLHKDLNELLITLSSDMPYIAINIQRYLLSYQRKTVLEKCHLDAFLSLTLFLKTFQTTLPSSSFESISIMLPLLISTCNRCLKAHEEIHREVSEKLNEMEEEQKLFFEQHTNFEIKRKSEMEKMHLQEPPENFRSLSILPSADDIDLPCSFLRPNLTKGKYKDTEHYLDVQFRLLKEDYIKPLRDGITEYLNIIRNKQSLKECRNVRVYSNAFIKSEEFVNGDLLHVIQFREHYFSEIKWENSKRFLTGNLLCLSTDNFRSRLFATVIRREPEKLEEGLLTIKFEEMSNAVLTLNPSINFVVIETSALFESYRHNLNVLQLLNEENLPMKRYIIDVEKTVNKPKYLKPTTTYDMTPLLLPLQEKDVCAILECPKDVTDRCKSVTVTDDSSWPTAAMLNLDESQYTALKSAITKEFAIIQGPPGTGKTFIGLRTVQLLLRNIGSWFCDKVNSLPILIVCYTNHALDQFLEGISMFTSKIVRIGGGRVSEKIEKFRIKSLVRSSSRYMPDAVSIEIWTAKRKIIELKRRISTITGFIECSTQHILNEYILRDYIPSSQFKCLRMYCMVDEAGHRVEYAIYDWLQIWTNNTSWLEEKSNHNKVPLRNILQKNEYSDREFKDQRTSNKKKIDKLIRDGLTRSSTMESRRALRIENVWMLRIHERWQLYKFWLERFIEGKRIEHENLQEELKIAFKNQSDARIAEELYVIQSAMVVGMTTTGAAKYRHIIDARNPVVLIVEEAAEILESHIITSLAKKTQHVVLIGDQQQLRPSPTVHMLGVKYGMNISLFERMIKNGMEYCRLSVQHRMRPEIASLIVPHIYPNLENHKSVTEFENVKGVSKNVYFITHNFDESFVHDSKSKENAHEARFIIQLCQYLIFQGYETSQITVLTTYSGQLFALKKLATGYLKEVRFTVVDNYQGEENDIILISFVRSNMEGEVGFLKISNRINVALSRAKKGLYCIGNFELLAQKSKLWKDILETLAKNKSVGPSLCLTCQNHPDVFNDVTSDADFAAVPNGGCNRKCDYRLQCGHRCVLFCHFYDRSHESFQCEKPCTKTCKEEHPCPKKCFEYCGSCEAVVNRVLTRCGHSVKAPCGKDEFYIKCQNPCIKTCKEGHPCSKKCFENCGTCKTFVDKVLTRCGHTVKAPCGKDEFYIKCQNPCIKTCKEGHPCSKKCFENCGTCKTLVDKVLTRCGHTVKAPCGKDELEIVCENSCGRTCKEGHLCPKKCFIDCGACETLVKKSLTRCGHSVEAPCGKDESHIKCQNPCIKTCKKGHPCSKKCFQICGACDTLVDRVLSGCGHTVNAPCGKGEWLIACQNPCSKTCTKGHPCSKKCFENCRACKFLVDKTFTECGHTTKVPCWNFETKKCESICIKTCERGHPCHKMCRKVCGSCKVLVEKTLKSCGHTVEAPCGKNENSIKCTFQCNKVLSCLHQCINKCYEPCVNECSQLTKIQSPVCGHFLKIECRFKSCLEKLSQKCSEPCRELLPCGHTCKGTCSRCHQGRLHVSCKEICKRILICGHKCESQCFQSCPPCEKPCENRCNHGKCSRKCSSSCVKCIKPCAWRCSHKKCNRLCHEVCDRDPCNEPCLKTLRCKHPCMGFCGEPCPRKCSICENKRHKKCEDSKDDKIARYIYLEDCKHTFKEGDLSTWMTTGSDEMQEIRMKACPKCKTAIRNNVRFGKIIKHCLEEIEKVKEITRWSKEKNLKIQSGLLEIGNISLPNFDALYKPIRKVLSSEYVRDIHELANVANVINIAKEIELKTYGIDYMFVLTPFLETLVHYTRCCREWLSDVILSNFLTASEFQLVQLLREIHRLRLLDLTLKFAKEKHFASLSPEFEKCTTHLANFKIFNDDGIGCFRTAFKKMTEMFFNECWALPAQNFVLKDVSMSGNWYQCSKEHITCIVDYWGIYRKICYKCDENTDQHHQYIIHPIITEFDSNACLTDTAESGRSNLEHSTTNTCEYPEKDFVQKKRSKGSCDKSPSTHSIAASASGRYTTSFCKNRVVDDRSNTSSRSFLSKDLNMKSTHDRKNCYGAVQKNITRNSNEEHSANRSGIPLTINKHVSEPHRGQNKRPADESFKRLPQKRFRECSMKDLNETNERVRPKRAEEYNTSGDKPLLRDYRQSTKASWHTFPRETRDPFSVSMSTPLFRNRQPWKFYDCAYERKNCTRNNNEEYSANRLSIPLNVNEHVSGTHRGQNKRRADESFKRLPDKRFRESSVKDVNETNERVRPKRAEEYNTYGDEPLLRDYRQRTGASWHTFPRETRDPVRFSRSTPLFRNRQPWKFDDRTYDCKNY